MFFYQAVRIAALCLENGDKKEFLSKRKNCLERMSQCMPQERLDKILASQGIGSRREMHAAIRKGQVTVNGTVIRMPDAKADPLQDRIQFMGKDLYYRKYLYLMMNKPAGVLSASRDPHAPTVIDLVPPEFSRRGLFPAGRLDKDTEGFVLITDDGELAHRILSPKKEIEKCYVAKLKSIPTKEDILAFADGIVFADGTLCRPAKLRLLEDKCPMAEIRIQEGMFHQVKRMFLARKNEVLWLKRTQIGGLSLDKDSNELEECF